MDNTLRENEDDKSFTLAADRHDACLQAAWEIEALAMLLPTIFPKDSEGRYLQLRGVASRLVDLSNAIMAGLNDRVVTEADVVRIVLRVEGGLDHEL